MRLRIIFTVTLNYKCSFSVQKFFFTDILFIFFQKNSKIPRHFDVHLAQAFVGTSFQMANLRI